MPVLPSVCPNLNIKPPYEQLNAVGFVAKTLPFLLLFMLMPLLSRINSYKLTSEAINPTAVMSGFVFGGMQDFAIASQAFFLLFLFTQLHSLLCRRWENVTCFTFILSTIRCVAVLFSILWATLPIFIDWGLQLHYQPRLNQYYITLFMNHSKDFVSSLIDPTLYSSAMVALQIGYAGGLIAMTFLVMSNHLDVPLFTVVTARRKCMFAMAGIIMTMLCSFLEGVIVTRLMGDDPNNNSCASNAMFTLQTARLNIPIRWIREEADIFNMSDSNSTRHFIREFIGKGEVYQDHSNSNFPFWRKTTSYKGKKRFSIKKNKNGQLPNILFLTLESFTATHVGVIGNRDKVQKFNKSITPEFDALSKGGVLFRRHYSTALQTSRSLTGKFFGIVPTTGLSTSLAKYRTNSYFGLPQTLKKMGYTNAFVSGVDMKWEHWNEFFIKNGFETIVDEREMIDIIKNQWKQVPDQISWGLHDHQTMDVLYEKLENLTRNSNSPYYVDYYSLSSHSPHSTPYENGYVYPHPDLHEFETPYNQEYIHALKYTDMVVGNFIRKMRKNGMMKNTIIFIQGDHGWATREHHGGYGNGINKVYNEAVGIPCLILSDDLLEDNDKGKTIDEASSNVDYFATVMDMIGIPESGFHQHGVGRSMIREDEKRNAVLLNQYGGGSIGFVGKELKHIFVGNGQIIHFNMTNDPFELNPLEEESIEKSKAMRKVLEGYLKFNDYIYDKNMFVPQDFRYKPPKKKL